MNDDDVEPVADAAGRRPTMGDIATYLGVVAATGLGRTPRCARGQPAEPGPGPPGGARPGLRAAHRRTDVAPQPQPPTRRRLHPWASVRPGHVDCLYTGAHRRNYGIVLSAATESHTENQAAHELLGLRAEGTILLGPNLPDRDLRALLHGDPMVMFGRRTLIPGIDSVASDDAAGVRGLVDHLVGQGHRDILHIDGADLPGGQERRGAYLAAMKAHGLDRHTRVLPGDYTEESGAAAAGSLVQNNALPTAIVAGNDRCAVGAMEVLLRLGIRVPDDVSVAGFDDSRLSRMSYRKLTTIRQDAGRLSAAILDSLVERIEGGRTVDKEVVVPTTLIVRDSSGPPP